MATTSMDLTVTSLETITVFDITTGDYMFTLDELQSTTIENAEEKSEVNGKGGRKLSTLKKNKTVTISGSNGLISGGLLGMQTGGNFESKTTEVLWTEYVTIKDAAAATSYVAIGTTGAEIVSLHVKKTDGTLGTEYTQGSVVEDTTFTYDPGTKALTFADTVEDGTEVVVIYKRKIQAAVLENYSDKYSGKCMMYIDAIAEDRCGSLFRIQFFIPKADFSGNFSIELGGDQAVHNFEAEALAGACGGAAQLWTYTVFGANAEDVA